MITQELLDYIKVELQQGTDISTITTNLTNTGWAVDDVQKAIIQQQQPQVQPVSLQQNPTIENSEKKSMNWLPIVLLVLLAVMVCVGGAFLLFMKKPANNIQTQLPLAAHTPVVPSPTGATVSPTVSTNTNLLSTQDWKEFKGYYLDNGNGGVTKSDTVVFSVKYPSDWFILGPVEHPGVELASTQDTSQERTSISIGILSNPNLPDEFFSFPYDIRHQEKGNPTIATFTLNGYTGTRGKQILSNFDGKILENDIVTIKKSANKTIRIGLVPTITLDIDQQEKLFNTLLSTLKF